MEKKSNLSKVIFFFLLFLIGTTSCSDECSNCTLNEETIEICLDGEISYTDIDGNVLPDNEVISYWESIGYECD